jgi:hypothetical protein
MIYNNSKIDFSKLFFLQYSQSFGDKFSSIKFGTGLNEQIKLLNDGIQKCNLVPLSLVACQKQQT